MEKLKRFLRNDRGSMGVSTLLILLLIMLLSVCVYEFMRLHITASAARNALEDAIVAVANENYDPTYRGTRQGYSGGYLRDPNDWTHNVTIGDVYAKLDAILHMYESGGAHEYAAGGIVVFCLSELNVNVSNMSLASGNSGPLFSVTASMRVTVPFQFGFDYLPPMSMVVRVSSGLQGG